MHQTISERWNRISLRTKITGVTVLMLTLGLLVSGIGTAAMLRSYVEEQTKGKLEAIASGDLMKYFTDERDLGHRPRQPRVPPGRGRVRRGLRRGARRVPQPQLA